MVLGTYHTALCRCWTADHASKQLSAVLCWALVVIVAAPAGACSKAMQQQHFVDQMVPVALAPLMSTVGSSHHDRLVVE